MRRLQSVSNAFLKGCSPSPFNGTRDCPSLPCNHTRESPSLPFHVRRLLQAKRVESLCSLEKGVSIGEGSIDEGRASISGEQLGRTPTHKRHASLVSAGTSTRDGRWE